MDRAGSYPQGDAERALNPCGGAITFHSGFSHWTTYLPNWA